MKGKLNILFTNLCFFKTFVIKAFVKNGITELIYVACVFTICSKFLFVRIKLFAKLKKLFIFLTLPPPFKKKTPVESQLMT